MGIFSLVCKLSLGFIMVLIKMSLTYLSLFNTNVQLSNFNPDSIFPFLINWLFTDQVEIFYCIAQPAWNFHQTFKLKFSIKLRIIIDEFKDQNLNLHPGL